MDYTTLVKNLYICAEGEHCDLCQLWRDKQDYGENRCQAVLCTFAADAIEELQAVCKKQEIDLVELTGELASIPAADVVPWEWLKRYASGMRMNYASDWVYEARKEYEGG